MNTLSASLREALEIARRDQNGGGARWISPSPQRMREIRGGMELSQSEFCRVYGFELESYRRWEQDRGQPEQGSRLLMLLIEQDPQGIAERITQLRTLDPDTPQSEPSKSLERV